MKEKISKVFKEIKFSLFFVLKRFLLNFDKIINLINPYLSLILILNFGLKFIFVPLMLFTVAEIAKKIKLEFYDLNDIPVYKKRFTTRLNGQVIFKIKDVYEMTTYLCELEDVFEKKGYYKQ